MQSSSQGLFLFGQRQGRQPQISLARSQDTLRIAASYRLDYDYVNCSDETIENQYLWVVPTAVQGKNIPKYAVLAVCDNV
jgi:hypothetical protein